MDIMTPRHNRITHYIPPAHIQPIVHEFVAPNSSDHFIYWLFHYRCIMCNKPATEINEIIPRGRSKKSVLDWRNRVTLCQECHTGQNGFHHHGVTSDKIKVMQEKRKEYLISIDRNQYL
jgi:5-methylcytosine-specific restriction endonuclease McrA